jgi:hypothetical protein
MSSSQKVELELDWCSHEAAKYAVEHWHYSKCLPVGNSVKVGVWENGGFVGCVIFSHGANNNIGKPYKLLQTECVELTRVALNKHKSQVSKIVSISLKMLKKQSGGIRLVVSYADNEQGHFGGIYQAGNWIYTGETKLDALLVNGKKVHRKTMYSRYGYNSVERLKQTGLDVLWATGRPKYKYLFPLDEAMRKQIEPLRKPYPKRATSKENVVSAIHAEEGGANPTVALHIETVAA